MKQKTAKNVLIEFGLTSKEADVYIFLAKYEFLTGGEIAEQTKIARSLVYRILKKLMAKGLVEPTLESPMRFVAVSFEKTLDLIIKTKQEEALTINMAKKDLLEDWKNISKAKPKVEYERFVVVEGNKKIYLKILQMIKETKKQFTGVLTISDLCRAEQFGIFEAAYDHPLKNSIKFQFVTEVNSQNIEAMKLLKPKLKAELDFKSRNFEAEVTSFPRLIIRDEEETLFFIRPEGKISARKQGEVCVYTNCESLVQTFDGIFYNLWHNSTDLKEKIFEIESGKLPEMDLIFGQQMAKRNLVPAEGYAFQKKTSGEKEFTPECVSELNLVKEDERDILDVASVIGEEFSLEIIEKLTGFSHLRVLKTLINIESQHQLIISVGDRYRFGNPLIRETLYNEIKPRLRRAYHSLVAQHLEEVSEDHLEDFLDELAHHYYHSGNAPKAIPYLLKAGENLRKQLDFLKAAENYSQVIELIGNDEVWKKERTSTLENLGDVYASIGEHEKANECYAKGIVSAENECAELRMRRKTRIKKTIEKNGVKIQYHIYGEGQPTILLVWNSLHFMPQIQYFSQKHKVVIMDLEELWEYKKRPTEYTEELYIENLRTIIEDLQDTNILLLGIAFGGTLAIKYVAKYPGKVAKLALLATPPRPPVSETEDSKKRLEEFWAMAIESPSWGLRNFHNRVLEPAWLNPLAKGAKLSELQKVWRVVAKVPPEIRLITNKILIEADVRPFLGKINVPTLILHGEKDIMPMEAVKFMKERIQGSKLHIFKDTAFVSLSEPDKLNKVIEEFLSAGKETLD